MLFLCNEASSLGRTCALLNTDGDEENASQQSSSQGSLDYLLQTLVSLAVSPDQGGDIEGHLRDGAKCGVHNCTNGKVTLR